MAKSDDGKKSPKSPKSPFSSQDEKKEPPRKDSNHKPSNTDPKIQKVSDSDPSKT